MSIYELIADDEVVVSETNRLDFLIAAHKYAKDATKGFDSAEEMVAAGKVPKVEINILGNRMDFAEWWDQVKPERFR